MAYEYQQLTSADVAKFKSLLKVFGEAFGDPDAYGSAVPPDTYLQVLLGRSHFIALTALDKGEVIGGLAAYELQKFEQERSEMYIYDLAVLEGHRKKGVATALIEKLKNIARERGAYVIFVQADIGDDDAIALYESLGTKEEVFHFDIPIE